MKINKYIVFCKIIITIVCISCSKKDGAPALNDGKSTVIEDLAGDTGASMNDGVDGKEKRPFQTFLFRLSDQRQIWLRNAADSAQWLTTVNWDLAFTSIYNNEVFVNNGKIIGNPGFGSAAEGIVIAVDKPYAQVTEAPDEAVFKAQSIKSIGRQTAENESGWYTYSGSTHLVQPIKSRTYVIQLPDGKFAKLELLNVYKGNPPAVTDMSWPAPYLTFRYFVQQDGSRNLKTI